MTSQVGTWAWSFDSMMIFSVSPVVSSVSALYVEPSVTFWKRSLPAYSVTITALKGSHFAMRLPFFTSDLLAKYSDEPYGTDAVDSTMPVLTSTKRASASRLTTFWHTTSPFSPCSTNGTARISSNSTRLSLFATMLAFAAALPATPPAWNVRSVSCVPGSPIACAAMTPTASPFCTIRCVARLRP